jgi:signal transduction histidine kinase
MHNSPSPFPGSAQVGNAARTDHTLVEAELVSSVAWLIRLRWIAGIGVLVGTWVVQEVVRLQAATGPLFAIGAGILVYNLLFFLVERRLTRDAARLKDFSRLATAQAILDWLAMTLLIHYSGGVESPAILFFIFHIIIASIFFKASTAFMFALLAAGLLAGTVLMELFGILPHRAIGGLLEGPLYQNHLYVTAVIFFFTSTALISAYLVSSIQKRLRQREEEVVRLSESLRLATNRLQALNDGARTISSTLDLPQVLNLLVKSTVEAMGVRACSIRLLDENGRRLEPVAVYGLSQAYLNKGPVDAKRNPLARRVLAGEIVNIPDALNSQLLQYPEEARQEGIRSVLSAPLIGKDGPLGILRAYAVELTRFTEDDEAFLSAIAAQGSIAIENAMAYRAVEALDASKGQFIRIITHELRSPVSVIRSLLRTLTGGYAGEISEQQRDLIERAIRRSDFLQKLIDDLLELAAGKTAVRGHESFEPVPLEEVVQKVIKRFEVPAREKQLKLEMLDETGDRKPCVMATLEGIDRIVNNLLSNAIKYTPEEGSVAVKITSSNGEASLIVQDTGIGIPEDALPHLFEEFFRAPNAKAVEQEGTGLGLTIIKDYVNRFGGKVTVQSTLGKGTRFTVTLPVTNSQLDNPTRVREPNSRSL